MPPGQRFPAAARTVACLPLPDRCREVGSQMSKTNPLQYLTEQLDSWREAGTFQRLRELESACAPVSRFDGHEVINLASNNYLGLTTHPKLIEAAMEATQKYGA